MAFWDQFEPSQPGLSGAGSFGAAFARPGGPGGEVPGRLTRTPPPPGQQAPAGQGQFNEQVFRQLAGGDTLTPDQLRALAPQLQAYGVRVLTNAAGISGKIAYTDPATGREVIVDVIEGAGAGGNRLIWNSDNGVRGGGQQPGMGGLPPGYSPNADPSGLAGFQAPGLAAPFTEQFKAPTGTDDPGFQFAMEQAQQAIQRSAAARGTLLTGGTLKDLTAFTTGAALQGYGDAWNRANTAYMQREGIWGRNADRTYGQLYGLSNLGVNAVNGTNNAAQNYATNVTNTSLDAANAKAAGIVGQGQGWQGALGTIGDVWGTWNMLRNNQGTA